MISRLPKSASIVNPSPTQINTVEKPALADLRFAGLGNDCVVSEKTSPMAPNEQKEEFRILENAGVCESTSAEIPSFEEKLRTTTLVRADVSLALSPRPQSEVAN